MKNLKLSIIILFLLPNLCFSQEHAEMTIANTKIDQVKIPGLWQELNTADDTGQTFFKNSSGVIIAVAQNPKKAYPFFKPNKSDFENVKLFYEWDSDFMIQNKFKTAKIKENSKLKYIVWKYNDGKLDNVYLFGSVNNNFVNLLIYTDQWSEDEKVQFLEKIFIATQ